MGHDFINKTRNDLRFGIPNPFRIPNARDVGVGRFFGRQNELDRLGLLFQERSPQIIVITGPGACGKTALAKKFAVRRQQTSLVRWLSMESSPDPENDVSQLLVSLRGDREDR